LLYSSHIQFWGKYEVGTKKDVVSFLKNNIEEQAGSVSSGEN
jgi:hypothetical protein